MEVTRWQSVLTLKWKSTEIQDVSSYLNELYYRFPRDQAS